MKLAGSGPAGCTADFQLEKERYNVQERRYKEKTGGDHKAPVDRLPYRRCYGRKAYRRNRGSGKKKKTLKTNPWKWGKNALSQQCARWLMRKIQRGGSAATQHNVVNGVRHRRWIMGKGGQRTGKKRMRLQKAEEA